MPELPEVETVRRSLDALLHHRVVSARALRPDVFSPAPSPASLLMGARIIKTIRTGKRLALLAEDGRALDFHLGMSGRLLYTDGPYDTLPAHTHGSWTLAANILGATRTLLFVDPRRFGRVRLHPSPQALEASFASLGPDALTISAPTLRRRLSFTRRPLKAALLDQQVLAGLGNIYADESCFLARLSPHRPADSLSPSESSALAKAIRTTLRRAIDLGGSTLRDGTYVNAQGAEGRAQTAHRVYARASLPCLTCSTPLIASHITARTTVHCPRCQS